MGAVKVLNMAKYIPLAKSTCSKISSVTFFEKASAIDHLNQCFLNLF